MVGHVSWIALFGMGDLLFSLFPRKIKTDRAGLQKLTPVFGIRPEDAETVELPRPLLRQPDRRRVCALEFACR